MEIQFSELTIKMLLLFFPGIIATLTLNMLTETEKESAINFFIKSFIFGLASYFALYLVTDVINFLLKIINKLFNNFIEIYSIKLNFLDCLINGGEIVSYVEILIATIVGAFIAIILSYVENKNLIYKLSHKYGISNKFGNDDVWRNVFNELEKDMWLIIRDYDFNFIYTGWVNRFSSNHKESEIFLKDVTVYNNINGNELYKTDAMYLCNLTQRNIRLEFKKSMEGENNI